MDSWVNPGSPAAIEQGCTCPRMDNGHGRGYMGGAILDDEGSPLFVMDGDCPLHGPKADD